MGVVALELVPILRGTFGSDILQGDTGQLRYSIPKQSRSWLRGVGRAGLRLWTMRCTVQDCMSNGPWVKHSGMDPRPVASAGLGPNFGQRGWNHGPHCRVEVHGPSRPRDPCAVQLWFLNCLIISFLDFFSLNQISIINHNANLVNKDKSCYYSLIVWN